MYRLCRNARKDVCRDVRRDLHSVLPAMDLSCSTTSKESRTPSPERETSSEERPAPKLSIFSVDSILAKKPESPPPSSPEIHVDDLSSSTPSPPPPPNPFLPQVYPLLPTAMGSPVLPSPQSLSASWMASPFASQLLSGKFLEERFKGTRASNLVEFYSLSFEPRFFIFVGWGWGLCGRGKAGGAKREEAKPEGLSEKGQS